MAGKHVYTIAPVFSFADTLAAGLLKQHEKTLSGLARTVIFLPTIGMMVFKAIRK